MMVMSLASINNDIVSVVSVLEFSEFEGDIGDGGVLLHLEDGDPV